MTALKTLTFTALPKIGANPVVDRRTKIIGRLEEQKRLLGDPNYMRTLRTSETKDGKRVPVENTAARVALVALSSKWNVCVFRSGRLQARRTRQGRDSSCCAFPRQAARCHRHAHYGGSEWRARSAIGRGEQAGPAEKITEGGLKDRTRWRAVSWPLSTARAP